jgi:tRNA A-37 threonylcarbamoyl transferase component Bud32
MKGSGLQKNGIYSSIDKAFDFFVNHCDFTVLSIGSVNGVIFKLHLHNNFQSPFVINTLGANFNKPATTLIMKCVLIDSSIQMILNKSTMTQSDFDNEVNIQYDVYNKSVVDPENLLEPLCPAIVHTFNKINRYTKEVIYKNCKETDSSKRKFIKTFLEIPKQMNLIVMESIEGFTILHEECDSKYEKFALYDLIRLHKYGYTHGDYHKGNILVNTQYEYYFGQSQKGKTMILDFGRSKAITTTRNHLSLMGVLQTEIASLLTAHTFSPSYIWLHYYLYNCIDKTVHFLENIHKLRIQNNAIITRNYRGNPNSLEIHKPSTSTIVVNGGKSKWGKSKSLRSKLKPSIRITRRHRK